MKKVISFPTPAPAERGDFVCQEADGCPTEKAVLQRFWREHQQAAVSTAPTTGSAPEYIASLPADWHVDSSLATWFPLTAKELESMTRMFHDACHDLGLINEALGLDPDDGGAEPILDAIAELKGAAPNSLANTSTEVQVCCDRCNGAGVVDVAAPAIPEASALTGWISAAERLPDVKAGTEREFIVACRRASNGKTYVFAASYLNEMGLMFDDDDCPEDGRPTTGWFNERNDPEYDNAFEKVCDEGDQVTHWMALPDAPALLAASMGGEKP